MPRSLIVSILAASVAASGPTWGADSAPPPAEKRPVTNTYWGVQVVDAYQYLENVTDPQVVRW
ncbi:MAG: hypothetical protein ACYS0G_15120, partial [Planctomycetota bacterium]